MRIHIRRIGARIIANSIVFGMLLSHASAFAQGAEDAFGYSRDEMLGQLVEILLPESLREVHPSLRTAFFEDPQIRAMGVGRDLFGRRKDGSELPIEMGLSPLEIDNQLMVIATIVDISERKQVEALRLLMIEELEMKNSELERFSYTVSHDLKSPLITIMGFAGKLKTELDAGQTEQAGQRLTRIHDAANKMGDLLENLLELSRIGHQLNPLTEFDFTDLAEEALELISVPMEEAGAVVEINGAAATMYGDHIRLREVLQNLVENSLKFTGSEAPTQIEIGAFADGDKTVYFVKDNGIGIDPAYHTRVFNLFEQLDSRHEGSGTGLALVKRIVEMHHGRIWIK